jgi:hypothetical protein
MLAPAASPQISARIANVVLGRSGARPDGVRDRKKRQARSRVVEAAFELFQIHGHSGTSLGQSSQWSDGIRG